MRWVTALRDERGFTIQEILVVLIVGSLVAGFGLSLFEFTEKLVGKWSTKSESRTVVNSICQQIAFDIQRSHGVRGMTDTSFVLKCDLNRYVIFRFSNKGVWRNGVSMNELPLNELAVHFSVDSAGIVREHIMTGNIGAGTRVLPPWSSRSKFEQALIEWNATDN